MSRGETAVCSRSSIRWRIGRFGRSESCRRFKCQRQTNADIGLVPDSGDPIGVYGPRHQDGRFGEVRVSAAPLAENVMAISIPMDGAVAPKLGRRRDY